MIRLLTLLAVVVLSMGAACSTTAVKPASDLSGAGFVQENPNEWSRANIPIHDRALAETIVVNRAACAKAPLCRK
jgi:hypothetical protein